MPLITTAALSRLQSRVTAILPDTCSILRKTSTPDGAGGQTNTWATIEAGTPCLITVYQGRKGGEEDSKDQRFDTVLWWRVDLPSGTDVTAKDRIISGSRTFEVLSVGGPESWEVGRLAMCTELL